MKLNLFSVTFSKFIFLFCLVVLAEEYSESVTLTYLPNYNILSDINFKLTSSPIESSTKSTDLGYFPFLIHRLVKDFGLVEGRLVFTRGIWDSERWSKAPNNPTSSGFQFYGHFTNDHESNLGIDERFDKAIELISGYFCASLNILKYSNSIKPTINNCFPPLQSHHSGSTLIAGIIPNEPVCIENLQPFFDLFPCSNRAGFAESIKQESIYQNDFHSIELEFVASGLSSVIETNFRIITVFDLSRWNRNKNWSLASLFGKSFKKTCPFNEENTKLSLRIPKDDEMFLNSLHHQKENISALENHFEIVYTGKELVSLQDIGASSIPKLENYIDQPNPLKAFRFKSGTTDDFGGFGLVLENYSNDPLDVAVIESIPWLFRVFLHEGEFALNNEPISKMRLSEYLIEFSIEPSINRKRNLLLQSKWKIPANCKIQIYFPFEREFLRIDEFPPNSERGIEMPGALIFYKFEQESLSETTNTLLFTWPIPDSTMPFNVITMTSTLSALFYGSFFNLIFRRFYLKHPNDPPAGLLPNLIWKLKTKIKKIFNK